jgi:superfamily II DNA or RNA helicase
VKITLRPHQERAIAAVRRCYAKKVRRVLLVAPTGFGKTAVSSVLIAWAVSKGRKVLFLVHRREIVKDTHRRLVAGGVSAGLIMADEATTEAPVQVASVATIVARETFPAADLIVWDEAHHTAAESYRAIAAQYPNAWHLGLTATPERADGVGLRDAFDELVVGATVRELQEAIDPATGAPYLAACEVVSTRRALESGTLSEDPVTAWKRHAPGRSTVLFARTVDESKAHAAAFNTAGIPAGHIDGTTPARDRDATLAAFAAGELVVLCNVFVLTEGWDCPRAKVCLLARSCGSAATYLQMIGRVLRAHQGESALLIDLVGAMHLHGYPDEERVFSLDGIERKPKKDRPWIRQCLTCGHCVLGAKAGPACARCGTGWPAQARSTVVHEHLGTVRGLALPTREELGAEYREWLKTERDRKYKPFWAAVQFKKKYGAYPNKMGVRA